ncbi:MAG: hypothetical protein ACOYCD_09845 [Kiritimatiellia bacterium]|jgi:tetratricopeptide (TPR) repeat protein
MKRNLSIIHISLSLCVFVTILAGCRTPAPQRPDPTIARETAAGRSAYAAESFDRAADAFERALQRARLMDNSAEVARNAYHMAVCLTALQHWNDAERCLDEATAAHVLPIPAEFAILRVKILRGAGRADDAIKLAGQWLDASQKTTRADGRAIMLILLADMLCDIGDYTDATTALNQIPKKAALEPFNRAELFRTLARIAAAQGDNTTAGNRFDQAAETFRQAARYPAMAACLADAGRAYAALDQRHDATDRLYRAARSLHEQGASAQALELLNQARPLADEAERNLIDALSTAINKTSQ